MCIRDSAADARGVQLGQQHEDDRADGDGTTEDIEKEEEQQDGYKRQSALLLPYVV